MVIYGCFNRKIVISVAAQTSLGRYWVESVPPMANAGFSFRRPNKGALISGVSVSFLVASRGRYVCNHYSGE